ncbi:MAG: hypothetical protein QY325_09120 [Flavobacteriales bacterium]|jgi:hypothetical protein|nr:MAG: hypothetical protein QY325_09120 [Flavobacteriales bacterium]
MNSDALFLMVATQLTVIAITGYFFVRVLMTPPKKEPDSYSENDEADR